MNKTLEKMKIWLLNDSKSYVVKRTHLERPRVSIAGFLYILAIMIILVIGIEFIGFDIILSPLDLLEPITKFFINVETGEPRNILGLVYLVLVFVGIVLSFFGLCLPGFYMLIKSSVLINKEWPDDPEKTQKWRDRHAKK